MMNPSRRRFLKSMGALSAAAAAGPLIHIPRATASRNAWIQKDGPIKVGVLFSQTGDLSVVEDDSTRVVLYAIDEINKNGGIGGMEIEPVVVDARSSIQTYQERISRLIRRDRVLVTFGGYTSASRRAILPEVMNQDHLLYYPTCYEGRECTQNVISTGPLANQHSKDLIPYMVEQFGPKTFFVGSDYIWPRESNRNAENWLEPLGGEVLGEEYVPLGGTDFTSVLNQIRRAQPDFVFSTVVGGSCIAFYRQFRDEGFSADDMPIAALVTGEIETAAMGADAGAGHFLSAPYFMALENDTNANFVDGFLSSEFADSDVTHYNMQDTYLSVYMFKYGLERAIEAVNGDVDEITPRMVRDVSGGIEIPDSVSPEGRVWLHEDNFHTWKKPKIGRCNSEGQFEIVKESPEHVEPEPFALYPERGVCVADGLKTPDGDVIPEIM